MIDSRLAALAEFARCVVRERGHASESDLQAFAKEGWGPQQVLEVVLAVAIKTMSNYTNAIVGVPLDEEVAQEV